MSVKTSRAPGRSMPQAATRPARRPRRTLGSTSLIVLPLLALGGHLVMFPLFLDPRLPGRDWVLARPRAHVAPLGASRRSVSLSALLVEKVLPVGAYRGYRIYLSLDDLANPATLAARDSRAHALAISVFVNPEEREGESAIGSLGRAVLDLLGEVSPPDRAALWRQFETMHRRAPGSVVDVDLDIPRRQRERFPFDRLFIVALDPQVSEEVLAKALNQLFAKVEQRGVNRLVLPRLGYRWDQPKQSFASYFDLVFSAIRPPSRPRDLELSLYRRWPTFTLEEAVAALNTAPPAEREPDDESRLPYAKDVRLGLLLGSLCLFVCSFRIPISLRNFVLIGIGFGSLLVGSRTALQALGQSLDPTWRLAVQVAVWGVIAVFFPVIVRWNPAELFEKNDPAGG